MIESGRRAGEKRPLPRFFDSWRAGWGPSAESWEPVDYLNQDHALPVTIAAGWLFNPSTREYRGALFLEDRFDVVTVDQWFERYPHDLSRIEAVVNHVSLFDVFANCDVDQYEDSLAGLAHDIGACWLGIVSMRYPERNVHVEIDIGGMPGSYGPAVTFWTERTESETNGDS